MSDHACADCEEPATVHHRDGTIRVKGAWAPVMVWLCAECASQWDRLYDEETR